MKALVTGGAGFIGSHLVELLIEKGLEVVVVDNLVSGKLNYIDKLPIEFHKVDIRDYESLSPLFTDIEYVFHLAGLADVFPSIENPREYHDVNVNGTLNVLEAAKASKIKKLVYAASASCYGNPVEIPTTEKAPISTPYPYALAKYLGEELAMHWHKVYELPVNSLRLFNVYGPRARAAGAYSSVFGTFLTQKFHNKPLTVVGDGTQTRDFVCVTDVAQAFYQAAISNCIGEIFNIGCGSEHSVNDIVKLLDSDHVNIAARPKEPMRSCANISKAKELLGWSPSVSLEEGVSELLQNMGEFANAPIYSVAQ